ncbi:MAG TPA: cysteine desulfurase-like protein [Vicinamibacterales bacterium]|jgi:cysteine desulfurase family protein (TIGR01976 family)|nr:cysteine desulfurase-like protein [Vicinamibacterales bacterium]
MNAFPVTDLRRQFPALAAAGDFLFFDNAAGAQIPASVLAAVTDHLVLRNVQRGGVYRHSREVDAMLARARTAVAAFVNARSPSEIAFGLNATSFIRSISLAVGQTLASRPEIIVSDLDHEANVATWLALERFGARISWWNVREDGRLHTADLQPLLSERTRLVACTIASNATGTRVDVAAVARLAHSVGAELFLDAVHFGPHGLIDVQAFECDYLVCSGYKIFSPHMGFACCRTEAINALPTFREEFIPDVTPDKLEAGTYVYENVAGMEAVVDYLEQLGRRVGADPSQGRQVALRLAMEEIAAYERTLSRALIEAIQAVPGATIHGVAEAARVADRVPTVSFTVDGVASSAIALRLAAQGIGVRSGHMYAPRLMTRFGLMPEGTVRVSLVHYNTINEVQTFQGILQGVVGELRAEGGRPGRTPLQPAGSA